MNFLAHIQLSSGVAGHILGNLVADEYKGSKYKNLEQDIAQGVMLHRYIDTATDTTNHVIETKKILRNDLGRYAGIALDVFFDHFLVIHWHSFETTPLQEYVTHVYETLRLHMHRVNEPSRYFLTMLMTRNWLLKYEQFNDLSNIFEQMAFRHKANELKNSVKSLENHYSIIDACFRDTYPLIVSKSKTFVNTLG